MTAIADPSSAYAFTSNANDWLTVQDNAGTPGMPHVLLTATYDPVGNRVSLDDSQGGLTSYTYDVRNELTTLTQSGSGVTAKRVDFAYDAALRRTSLTRYSDLAGTTTVLQTTYGYDAGNRLTGITHQTAGGTVRSQYTYTLDAADRLTSEGRTWTTTGGTATDTVGYSSTNDGQLTGVTHTNGSFAAETFSYDTNGNRTMAGYGTGTGNRLTTDGTYNYQYDDEGNLTVKTQISTGNQTLYTWDYRNRLVEVDQTVAGVTTPVATYTYDALDRRIKTAVGATVRWTAYDGESAVLDFTGAGAQTARYLQGPLVDEVLARETSGGVVAWYLADREGTIRDLSDNSGNIIDRVDYSAYGKVGGESAPTAGDRWKYTGREYDSETGLYQYRARYYDAAVGRFLTEDPIGLGGGDNNLYRYVGNSPTDFTDPGGLQANLAGTYPVIFPRGFNVKNAIVFVGPPKQPGSDPMMTGRASFKKLGVPGDQIFEFDSYEKLQFEINQAIALIQEKKLTNVAVVFYTHGRPGGLLIGDYDASFLWWWTWRRRQAVWAGSGPLNPSDRPFDEFITPISVADFLVKLRPLLRNIKGGMLIFSGCSTYQEVNGEGQQNGQFLMGQVRAVADHYSIRVFGTMGHIKGMGYYGDILRCVVPNPFIRVCSKSLMRQLSWGDVL